MKKLKKQNGFSLVEIILYLMVVFAVLVTIFVWYKKYSEDVTAQRTVEEIKTIIASSESLTINQDDYAGVTLSALYQSQALPTRVSNGTVYKTPWGGDYTLATMNSATGTDDLLVITITNIPQQGCSRIMSSMATSLYSMTINNKTVALTPAASNGAWNRNNIDFSKAGTLCTTDNKLIIKKLKEFDTMKYLNPATSVLSSTQTAYVTQERARITAAMQARENVQAGL